MLLATTFDPAVLDSCSDEAYSACLADHFRGIISCHVLVGQNGTRIKSELQQRIEALPHCLQSRAMNLFPELRDRLIMLDFQDEDATLQQEYICAASRAAAMLANSIQEIDAGIVHKDTKAAAELEAEQNNASHNNKLFTLPEFRSNPIADREHQAVTPIAGLSLAQFQTKIIKPLVYWAKHVKLIDKQLGQAVADEGANLVSFQETVRLIYDTWHTGHFTSSGKPGRFELITVTEKRKSGHLVTAEGVANAMDPGERRILFRVKPPVRGNDLFKARHDRYISTNLDIAFGFSSGLDALGHGGKLGAGDIYLRHRPRNDEDDVIARWEAVEQHDDVFEWPKGLAKYA